MANISRKSFIFGTVGAATTLALGVVTQPAQAAVSVHAQATVKGFWPEYRGICPCGWKGSWGSKDHAWNQVDGHKISNGLNP